MEKAIKKFEEKADFEVKWLPFQLNPAASKEGVDKMQMYMQKFGEDRVRQMLPRMIETGKQDGISFSYGGKTGNTFDSHRLISKAWKEGAACQDRLVEELFKNYFEQEKFIGEEQILVAAGEKAGMKDVQQFLRSDEEVTDVRQDLRKYQDGMNISGVPHFIVGGKYQVSGAQDAATFEDMFNRLLA